MKITGISLIQISGPWQGSPLHFDSRQAQPLDVYSEFNTPDQPHQYPPPGADQHALYVEIHTDAGITGHFGPIEDYQAYVIHSKLRPFLLGRDPLAIETLHDQMTRLNRHGRSGVFMTAISVIDCALWDLKGKAWDQPVYRLLGGPTRSHVPAYASMLGFSVEPEAAAAVARDTQAQGYPAQKWFFRYGPENGAEGIRKNLAMARAVREAVGPEYPLMFDAFMGWDVAYAVDMAQRLAPLMPRWLEEPVPPEQVSGLCTIRTRGGVPVATGEHVYTRWQVQTLLEAHAVDVIQTDPDWTGGITEQVKICALTSAYGLPTIAHGHSLLPALHIAAAQSPGVVPLVEYLIKWQEVKQFFQQEVYRPENGVLALPEHPGLGIVLDESKITSRAPLYRG